MARQQSIKVDRELLIAELTKLNKRDADADAKALAEWQVKDKAHCAKVAENANKILTALSKKETKASVAGAYINRDSEWNGTEYDYVKKIVITLDDSVTLASFGLHPVEKAPVKVSRQPQIDERERFLAGLALSTAKEVSISLDWHSRYLK